MFNMLSIGKKAVMASEKQLETTAHNIANVNTPGFSRQRVIQQASLPINSVHYNYGTGVDLVRIERMRDLQLDTEFRRHNGQAGYWDTMARHLTHLEKNVLETTDFGIHAQINAFFNTWESLSNNPYSNVHRIEVVSAATQLTEGFQNLYRSIEQQKIDATRELQTSADRINQIAKEMEKLIGHISLEEAQNRPVNDLLDQFDLLVDELSQYGDVQIHHRENGTSSVYFGTDELVRNGHVNTLHLVETKNFATGEISHVLAWNKTDSPIAGLYTGSIKALDDLRNVILPEYQKKLDELVVQIANQVNNIHTQGYNLYGSGANFFDPNVTGVMDFTLSKEVLTDPSFIATSLTGATGDNQIALMMTDLRLDKVFDGQTLTESFADIIYTVGQDVRFSKLSADRTALVARQTDNFRESVKGVSMNEETANLMKFQQSYMAAAKIISVADEMLKTILGLVR